MSEEIEIILAKANCCGFCKNFEPIYAHSIKNYKNNKELKNLNLIFSEHDLASEEKKSIFMKNHLKAGELNGYPTVLIKINNKKKDNEYLYLIVEHTVLDEKQDKKKQVSEASARFLQNISNVIKSFNTENRILYTQSGGDSNIYKTSLEEETYRKKYAKYKSKYLQLKIKF